MKFLVMAGGSGERFWPLSTKKKPKQLLSLFTKKTMIRETIDRVLTLVKPNDIYVATNEIQSDSILFELKEIPQRNIIIEPEFKDTAAAIAYGSMIISRDFDDDQVIVVLASDHLISNVDSFIETLLLAEKKADEGYIVTLGIKPTKPETGYGYIKLNQFEINKPTKVLEFMEKPNYETATHYFDDGNYVWNSGIFVFKYSTIVDELLKYIPNHVDIIKEISSVIGTMTGIELARSAKPYFQRFERISIDYAVMEKSKIIQCIPVDFGWNDVGGFNSLDEIFDKDAYSNIVRNAKYIQIDSSNNIIISNRENRLITSIGVSNMVIVDTDEALFICKKEHSQRIKELLKKIESTSGKL